MSRAYIRAGTIAWMGVAGRGARIRGTAAWFSSFSEKANRTRPPRHAFLIIAQGIGQAHRNAARPSRKAGLMRRDR